jgi:adenylate kinase
MLNIIFFGLPGSGKGTQSLLISKQFSFIHLCAGDILRQISRRNDLEGNRIKSIINYGNLVPDDIINNIIKNNIINNNRFNVKGIIYDGYPRTLIQAKYLDAELSKLNLGCINFAFFLSVSNSITIQRVLNRNARLDDSNINIIKNRINKHNNNIQDLIDFYHKKKCLYKVNSEHSINIVHQEIKSIILNNIN